MGRAAGMNPSSKLDAKVRAATKLHFSGGGGLKCENKPSKALKLAHRFTGSWKLEFDVRKQEVQVKLTAILNADGVGYSRLMGEND